MAESAPSVGDGGASSSPANSISPETPRNPLKISRKNLLRGIAGGAGLAVAGVGTAFADTPTPMKTQTETPTSTPSPTADPFSAEKTAVAGSQATVAAVQTKESYTKAVADAKETETAAQAKISKNLGTPTNTPTPNATVTRAAALEQQKTRIAREDATQTVVAQPTLTNSQRALATAEALQTKTADEGTAAQIRKESEELQKRIDAYQATSTPTPGPSIRDKVAEEAAGIPTEAKVAGAVGALAAVVGGAAILEAKKGPFRKLIGRIGGLIGGFRRGGRIPPP